MELTGMGQEDARAALAASGNNLEAAIATYFDDRQVQDISSEEGTRENTPQVVMPQVGDRTKDEQRRAEQRRDNSLAFRPPGLGPGLVPSPNRESALEELFRTPPYAFVGSLRECCAAACRDNQWIFVCVLRPADWRSSVINRDLWRDELVSSYIKLYFLLWETVEGTADGDDVTRIYNLTPSSIPYISIVDPFTRAAVKTLNISKVFSQGGGSLRTEIFVDWATDFIERSPHPKPVEQPKSPEETRQEISPPLQTPEAVEDPDDEELRRALELSAQEGSKVPPAPVSTVVADPLLSYMSTSAMNSVQLRVRLPHGEWTIGVIPQTPMSAILQAIEQRLEHDGSMDCRKKPGWEPRTGFPPTPLVVSNPKQTIGESELGRGGVIIACIL